MYNIGEENEQIEFKKSTGELKEGVIAIASILNKHGSGELYFGVKNNGDVIGIRLCVKSARQLQIISDRRYIRMWIKRHMETKRLHM